MDNRSSVKGLNIGITSIAVIFVVICMTIFAVLSLSTASQERELANKYAASVSDYWAADTQCTDIANEFGALWESGADLDGILALAQEHGADVWDDGSAYVVTYYTPINDNSSIIVTLSMGSEFTVTGWQQVYTGNWEVNDNKNVFQGW